MSSARIAYSQHPDATPETELSALANVYRFVLDSAKKNAAGVSSTNGTRLRNTEEVSNVERRPR